MKTSPKRLLIVTSITCVSMFFVLKTVEKLNSVSYLSPGCPVRTVLDRIIETKKPCGNPFNRIDLKKYNN